MVLVGLHQVEVGTKALLEAVVAVKLELGTNGGVAASVTGGKTSVVGTITGVGEGSEVNRRDRVTSAEEGREVITNESCVVLSTILSNTKKRAGKTSVKTTSSSNSTLTVTREARGRPARLDVGEQVLPSGRNITPADIVIVVISVVSPLVHVGVNEAVTLYNPNQLLNGVVEIELDLNVGAGDRLVTGELKLLNKVLMSNLSHTTTLIGIKVDVVYEKSGVVKRRHTESTGARYGKTARADRVDTDIAVSLLTEFKVDTHLVVLEGDQRKSTLIPYLSIGTRLYLKPSMRIANSLRPRNI